MPLHGIDHVELYVGNAAQAAYWFTHALGFRETAYAGLETGIRDRSSHVLEQGRIRLVLTAPLLGTSEIARHVAAHGDGVQDDRALGARRRARLPLRRPARRARRPRALGGERRARHGAAGDDRHLRRHAAHVRRARRLRRRLPARLRRAATTPAADAGHVRRHRPRRRQRRARPHGRVGRLLRARLRDDRDDPLLRRRHLDRVLGADVEGDGRRQRPRQVPDQRARRGQAQVADRGVPRVLRRPGRPAHRPRDDRHRRHRRASCTARGVGFLSTPTSYYEELPGRIGEIDEDARRPAPSSGSSSTATTRATCCRSSPSRSATGRPCSSR